MSLLTTLSASLASMRHQRQTTGAPAGTNWCRKKIAAPALCLCALMSCLPGWATNQYLNIQRYYAPGLGSSDHPFPPFLIKISSRVVTANASTGAEALGDMMSLAADGVDQGHHLDCWFESAVGAVSRSPRGQILIARMIVRTGENTYTVCFPDDPSVAWPISLRRMKQLKLKDRALWADVLEGALMNRYPAVGRNQDLNYLHAKYGYSNNAPMGLRIMTGSQPSYLKPSDSSDGSLSNILTENVRLQIPTTVCSLGQKQMPGQSPDQIVVVPDHIFAILAYDPRRRLVTLRNPWGHNRDAKFPNIPKAGEERDSVRDIGGGVIRMPLIQLKKYFSVLAWSPIR